MEVECWRSLPSGVGASTRRMSIDVDAFTQRPDVVIPFCCFVDIGVMTNVNKYPTSEVRCCLGLLELLEGGWCWNYLFGLL